MGKKPTENIDLSKARVNPKYTRSMEDILREEMKDPDFKAAYEQEDLRFEIAKKIKLARQLKQMSQIELANRAHTTQKVISRIEQGQVSVGVSLLQRVTGALGLRVTVL